MAHGKRLIHASQLLYMGRVYGVEEGLAAVRGVAEQAI